MINGSLKKYSILLIFLLAFTKSELSDTYIKTKLLFETKYKSSSFNSFAENNEESALKTWIKDHLLYFILSIVGIVALITIIVIVIVCLVKLKKKYNDLHLQINKISFKDETRPGGDTIDDDLLV